MICLIAFIIRSVCGWVNIRFGVSFEEILFTITSPMAGADTGFLMEAVTYVGKDFLTKYLWFFVLMLVIGLVLRKIKVAFDLNKIYKLVCFVLAVVLLGTSISYGVTSLKLDEYIANRKQKTTLYEDYYVEPTSERISLEEEPKNIIYIYIESMETTYASEAVGGAQEEINYIPNLTNLAFENTSFSNTDKLGGAYVTTGAGWTMGALFASTTGVPFAFPVEGNSMGQFENFAPGITSFGEILESYGYKNVFLCGSDGTFAGRSAYFQQHGNYEVKDYYYALSQGYIDEGYYVWWGYEDLKLYDIAKKEITALAAESQPFNFTMLTADTHHVDGYVCSNCKSTYDHQLGNVLECADSQIIEFVNWCKEQEFYDNTVIVITGDHFRMDLSLVEGKERRLYNCIINSDTIVEGSTSNRVFTSLDFFPTTLSAMGFEIEGDRLGLGTDLYSDTQTLAEKLGVDVLDQELSKYSKFYLKEFN